MGARICHYDCCATLSQQTPPQALATEAAMPETEKEEPIEVRVVADAENGENVVNFKMKLGMTFGKMMAT